MAFVIAATAVQVGAGVYKAVQGKKAADAAAEEAKLAREEMNRHKKAFEALDTSNPYLNMENTMEDLTINQQEAEFQKQQAMQSQANIMGQMRGAAGSSGIAALAQSLANEGSLQAQKASASIGAQEAANQKLERGEASRIQGLEREGDLMSRNMQFGKTETLMGMSADQVSNAQAMEAAGRQQMMAGIGDVASGLTSFAEDYDGNWGGNKTTGPDANGQFADFASYNESMGGNMTQQDWVNEQQNYINLQNTPKSIYG
jgi:hypothetical protein